jgi:flagellar basal-body rod modification protein FlgD
MTTVSGTNGSSGATTSTTTSKTQTLGQSDFLNLLVAQLKYQDPLNPSDPTEFTSQLAQYSQLEQLFNLNDSMGALSTAQNNSERLSALSLMGQDVVVEGSDFNLAKDAVQIGYKVDGAATAVKLNIQNAKGKTVATLNANDVSEGNHFLTWNGKDSSGNALDPGTYSIVIDATSASGTSATVSPLVRSQVTGVDLSGSEAQIVTKLGEYKVSSIFGAYATSSSS